MRVTIAGAGKVGTFIANNLHSSGHEVIVGEQVRAVVERRREVQPEITWEIGDVCEMSFLDRLGLANSDVFVAVTGDDEDNLVASLLAKQEFAVPRVIARVNHPNNEWLFNETWGVDIAVSTPHLLTSLIEEAVSVGSLVRLLQLNRGEAQLVEVTLVAQSPAVGHSLADLAVPRDATIVAVLRDRHVVVPRGDTVLQVDDEVIVLVTRGAEDAVRALLVA